MNPKAFVSTIYLGDRFCKSILIDGYNERVKVQINMISRIRSISGNWEFYNDENIEDGQIVFTGVETVLFEPQGLIPNDAIEFESIESIDEKGDRFLFTLSASSINRNGEYAGGVIKIIATSIHLEDPLNPGIEIKS